MPENKLRLRVECPACGDSQLAGEGQEIFRCQKCGGMFDKSPDEGGDYDDRDPSRRLERQEEMRRRRAKHSSAAQSQRATAIRRNVGRG